MHSRFEERSLSTIKGVSRTTIKGKVLTRWTREATECAQMEKAWKHWSRDLWVNLEDLIFVKETHSQEWGSVRERCTHLRKRKTVHWTEEYFS